MLRMSLKNAWYQTFSRGLTAPSKPPAGRVPRSARHTIPAIIHSHPYMAKSWIRPWHQRCQTTRLPRQSEHLHMTMQATRAIPESLSARLCRRRYNAWRRCWSVRVRFGCKQVYFYADRSGISGTHCWEYQPSLWPGEGVGGSGMTCIWFSKASTTVCRIYRILPPIHPELCRTIGTASGSNQEGSWICLDYGMTRGTWHFEGLPTPGSHIGFSDGGWPLYPRYGRQPLCGGWRPEPAPRGSGSYDCLHQPFLRFSQCRYCSTQREMLAAGSMCTHFRSYLRGAQLRCTLIINRSVGSRSFRTVTACWLDGIMLLGQFSLTFQYRPGAQHANADGLSRQCGQCLRPDCLVSSPEGDIGDSGSTSALLDQPFASSAMGDSMDADLLPELSGETWGPIWMKSLLTYHHLGQSRTWASRLDKTLITVREWIQSGWSDCARLSPGLWSW